MGAQNVALVFTRWGHLHHAPFRALVYMAHRSLDSGNPPKFWGGREEIAMALGRPIPEPYGDEFDKKREADYEVVRKVTRTLTRAGAISLDRMPGPGQHAVYALHLRLTDGGNSVPTSGGNSAWERGELSVGTGGNQFPPKEKKEPEGLKLGVDSEDDQQRAGVAHARASDEKNYQSRVIISESERDSLDANDIETSYRVAVAVLARREDLGQPFIDQAQAEMPNAEWNAVVIRAAQIFAKGIPA